MCDGVYDFLEGWIVDKKLSMELKNAKGMRNIIMHDYGKLMTKLCLKQLQKRSLGIPESLLGALRKELFSAIPEIPLNIA